MSVFTQLTSTTDTGKYKMQNAMHKHYEIVNALLFSAQQILASISGVGKWWGMSRLGVMEPSGGGNKGIWENLHLFRIYDSRPDGTDIVTFHDAPCR